MKKVRITKLLLRWFKGVESADYEFGDRVNVVKGKNGIGKTTIADAVSWVLFGTDKDGNAKFGIKTKDAEGKVVADVAHSVTLHLDVDGEEVTLTRRLTDTRKSNGSIVNNYEYRVNGEVETAGDYKKAVDAICPERVWRLCSQPGMFAEQDWTEQRRALTEMFGEADVEEIAGGDERLAWVAETTKKASIDDTIRRLGNKRKEVQVSLDGVPIRLGELEKALPKEEDWDTIAQKLHDAEIEREKLQKALHLVEAGQGASVEAENIRKRLAFEEKRKREMETGAMNMAAARSKQQAEDVKAAAEKVAEAEANVLDLGRKREAMDELVERCDERQKELEAAKQDGAARWKTITARTWEWNDEDAYCPTCGQMLPEDRLKEIRAESEARFNVAVAKAKKELLAEAQKIKDDMRDCEKEAERYGEEQKTVHRQLEEAEKILADAKAAQKTAEGKKVPSMEDILVGMESYKDVQERIGELEKRLDGVQEANVDKAAKERLEVQIKKKEDTIQALADTYATKLTWDRVAAQMEDAKKDRTTWQKQADDLDERISEAREWQHRECEVLERKVNEHFGLVRWSLFARQLDGTEKPWCECSVDGTPYGDLNTAAQTNAGLDIIHTLKEYCGVDVPCIVDRAESVQEMLYDGGQQIRLMVTEDERIRVERHED